MNGSSSEGPIRSDRSSVSPSKIGGGKRDRSGSPTPGTTDAEATELAAPAPLSGKEYGREALSSAVDDLNRAALIFDRRFEFRVHEETNRVIVDVYDRETDELIREIPPEKVLDAVAKMQELLGLLFDERV